jgi:hypothetical protein
MMFALASLAFVLTQIPDLNALQWKSRVLLLFAPDDADTALQSQLQKLSDQERQLQERDLKVYQLTGNGNETRELRRRFGVQPDGFAVVLIGKDGGRKMKKTQPVEPAALYGKVDSMPMRKNEMRREAGKN